MKLPRKSMLLITAAALTLPGAALAQENVVDEANAVAETAQQLEQEANALSNAATDDAATAIGDDRTR